MPITIDNTGQTVTLNPPYSPATPDDSLQRITAVYFAKKTVTNIGTAQAPNLNVTFTRIDSLNTQQDAAGTVLTYDSILGKTVYLVIETSNMATLSIDAVIRPSDNALTGNTDTLSLMKFNTQTQVYQATRLLTAEVGNFDALNNRITTQNPTGSHAHYTNLAQHNNKAIIKLQLRPATLADFNTWARNIAAAQNGRVNLEVVVERNDNQQCAYGTTATEEVNEAGIFLNTDALGRFRIVNRNFYSIYARVRTNNTYVDNSYNFLELSGTNRRKISKVVNNNSTQVCYFYFDQYDNEMLIATCALTNVLGRNNGVQLGSVTPGSTSRIEAPNGGEAQYNYLYANNDIVTTGSHRNGPRERRFPNQLRIVSYSSLGTNVSLVRMPDTLNINRNNIIIAYGFSGSQRRYCNPECFAGFIGVLAQYGIAGVNSTGMCFGDATSYPSLSHPNGDSVDTVYMNNRINQQRLLDAFVDWNFTEIIAGTSYQSWLLNAHRYAADHDNHLHSGNFDSTTIQVINN